MYNQLLDLIKNYSQESIINNPEVPNEQNEAIMQEAQNSILAGLQGANESELNRLAELADNNQLNENDPQVQHITQNFMNTTGSKFGLNSNALKAIAVALIPIILQKIMSGRKNQSSGGLDLGGILGGILGGGVLGNMLGGNQQQNPVDNTRVANQGQGGLMDKLSDLGKQFGMDKNNDGRVDLNDFK